MFGVQYKKNMFPCVVRMTHNLKYEHINRHYQIMQFVIRIFAISTIRIIVKIYTNIAKQIILVMEINQQKSILATKFPLTCATCVR